MFRGLAILGVIGENSTDPAFEVGNPFPAVPVVRAQQGCILGCTRDMYSLWILTQELVISRGRNCIEAILVRKRQHEKLYQFPGTITSSVQHQKCLCPEVLMAVSL